MCVCPHARNSCWKTTWSEFRTKVPSRAAVPAPTAVPRTPAADAGAAAPQGAAPAFQALLTELLARLCRDHPFHALFQVLALKNGDKGRDGRRGTPRTGMTYAVDHAKVAAAEALVARLKGPGAAPAARELVAQVLLWCWLLLVVGW